jgi:hypothetical protein
MESNKPPAQIELAEGDVAFVIRANGDKELTVPDQYIENARADHLMLVSFALAFDTKELEDFMINVISKKYKLPPKPGQF